MASANSAYELGQALTTSAASETCCADTITTPPFALSERADAPAICAHHAALLVQDPDAFRGCAEFVCGSPQGGRTC